MSHQGFIVLNSIELPIEDGEWEVEPDYLGARAVHQSDGTVGARDRFERGMWRGRTPILKPSDVEAYLGLLNGDFDVFTYEATGMVSARGFAPRGDITQNGASPKFGTKKGAVSSAGVATLPSSLSTDDFAVFTYKVNATGEYTTWTHIGYRSSDGHTYENGAYDASEAATNWLARAGSNLQLLGKNDAGTDALADYDNTVICRFTPTDEMMATWSADDYEWETTPPYLSMEGEGAVYREGEQYTVRCVVTQVEPVEASIDGVWCSNAARIHLEAFEVAATYVGPDPWHVGLLSSFFEDFETNNNTDWEGIEVVEDPVDFSNPEETFTDDFEGDWGFSGGGDTYLDVNTYGGRPIVWYNIQNQALGAVTSLLNSANTGQLGDATGDLTVPGSSNAPQCIAGTGVMAGRQYIEFDASNLEALQGSLTTSRATGCFFAMVIRMRAATASVQHVLDGNGATNRMTLSANATGSGADWMINSGSSQTSGAAIEEEKWVRVVGRFGANGALNVERARHITGNSGTNTLDGITLGCRYDETLYGGFDLAEFIMWEVEGDNYYVAGAADNHLGMAGWLLEYNFQFPAVPPGNPVHWYDPNDYAVGQLGLVAHWSFDDADTSGGVLADTSGAGLDATLVGSPTTGVTGQLSQAYTFNGTTQYLDVGNQAALDFDVTDAFSVSCWYKTPAGATSPVLVSKYSYNVVGGQGWSTFVNPDGSLGFFLANYNFSAARYIATSALTYRDDTWRHVVFTYDGSNTVAGMKIYVNDVSVAVSTLTNTDPVSTMGNASVFIGARDDASPSGFMDGEMDEAAVFDHELSAAEVSALYATTGRPTTGLGIVVDKGSGGSDLTCTALAVALDTDCPERRIFKFNGTASRAVDAGGFSLTGDIHLFAMNVRSTVSGTNQNLMGSNGGTDWRLRWTSANTTQRDFGSTPTSDDLDTLAPFNNPLRWVSMQFLTAAAAGNGGTYLDGNLSAVANEGDSDPSDLSIGAQAGAGYFTGNMSDILIYTGANEATAARAAQVRDWLRRHRRLATLPVSTTPPFLFDAERMGILPARIGTIENFGTEDDVTVYGGSRVAFKYRSSELPVIPDAPKPDGTGTYVEDFFNNGAESDTAFSAISQPAGFAIVGEPKAFHQFLNQRKAVFASDTASTQWLAGLLGLGTFNNSESNPFIDAGVVLTATGGTKWQSFQKANTNWIAGEFNGASSHVGDSLGNTASGNAGTESLGTKLTVFSTANGSDFADWRMNLIVIAPGVSYEKLVEWLQMRYPNLDRQAT